MKPSTGSYKAAWDGRSTGATYTRYTLDAIEKYGSNLLNTNLDNKGYCRRYNQLTKSERKQFWLMMVSMVAKFESGFRTNAKYKESNGNYSRGLLQLGYAGYGNCNIRTQQDRHDARKNLRCGVVIMNHWMKKDKMVRGFYWKNKRRKWLGVARYWSVLRTEIWGAKKRARLAEIKKRTSELPFCR